MSESYKSERLPRVGSVERGQTKTERAIAQIRQRIIEGVYPPGTLLVEKPLADDLKMSRQPIGDALAALAHEGLIEVIPKKGSVVKQVDFLREMGQLLLQRSVLEEFIAVELTVNEGINLEPAWEIHRRMELISEKANEPEKRVHQSGSARGPRLKEARKFEQEFLQADIEFHDKCAQLANHPLIAEDIRSIRDRLHRIARPHLFSDSVRMARVCREHRGILETIRPGYPNAGGRGVPLLVRLQVRAHIIAAARRWRFEQVVQGLPHFLIRDLPEIFDLPPAECDTKEMSGLLELRAKIEELVALDLAEKCKVSQTLRSGRTWLKEDYLHPLENYLSEMANIALALDNSARTTEGKLIFSGAEELSRFKERVRAFQSLHTAFHVSMVEISKYYRYEGPILDILQRLHSRAKRAFREEPKRMVDVVKSHRATLEAIRSDDEEAIVKAVQDHKEEGEAYARMPLPSPDMESQNGVHHQSKPATK